MDITSGIDFMPIADVAKDIILLALPAGMLIMSGMFGVSILKKVAGKLLKG